MVVIAVHVDAEGVAVAQRRADVDRDARRERAEPRVVEYLKTPPTRVELAELIRRMGIPVRGLLRRKGTPYHDMNLDDPALTDDQLLDAMLAHPILINRPIVVTKLGVKLCRPSETVLDMLPAPHGAPAKPAP